MLVTSEMVLNIYLIKNKKRLIIIYIYYDKKSFFDFTNKFSQLYTTGVREHQNNVTCFDLVRSHQTCILVECMGGG